PQIEARSGPLLLTKGFRGQPIASTSLLPSASPPAGGSAQAHSVAVAPEPARENRSANRIVFAEPSGIMPILKPLRSTFQVCGLACLSVTTSATLPKIRALAA